MRQLMNDIVLCGAGEDGHFTREFKNIRYIGEGASVICYEANYSHSGKGILKEFWPKDMYALERRPNGQLMYSEGFPAAMSSSSKTGSRSILRIAIVSLQFSNRHAIYATSMFMTAM